MMAQGRSRGAGGRFLAVSLALAFLALSASCGDDDDGPSSVAPQLSGNEGVEASSGLAISTVLSFGSFTTGIPFGGGFGKRADVPHPIDTAVNVGFAYAAALKNGSRPAQYAPLPCDDGGSVDLSCSSNSSSSTMEITYNNCTVVDTVSNTTTTMNGTLSVTVQDPAACDSGSVADSVETTMVINEFSATVIDNETQDTIESFTADLTVHNVPTVLGCEGWSGTTTMNGSYGIVAGELVDISFTATNLTYEASSTGDPGSCLNTLVLNGSASINDHVNDVSFAQTFVDLTITSQDLINDRQQVTLDGRVTTNCVGQVIFQTIDPIITVGGAGCPAGGTLLVTLPGDVVAQVIYTLEGGVDFDYNNDDVVDESFTSCEDPEIAQCQYPTL
jgi:hypothetical protein